MTTDYKALTAAEARFAHIVQLVVREGDKAGLNQYAAGDALSYLIPALAGHSTVDATDVADALRDLRVTAPLLFNDDKPADTSVQFIHHGRTLTAKQLHALPARERLDVINEADARMKRRA